MSVRKFESFKDRIKSEYSVIKDVSAARFTLAEILFLHQLNDSESSYERIREIRERVKGEDSRFE
jgi:hypothetical protein